MEKISHILSPLLLFGFCSNFLFVASSTDLESPDNNVRYLKSIGVQVGDNGCNCWMKLYIGWGNTVTESCYTNYLDTSSNDFKSGEYQTFSSPEILGECYLKKVIADVNTNISIWHSGNDGVDIKYWTLSYVNGDQQHCKDGNFYDDIVAYTDDEIRCIDTACPVGYFPEEGDAPSLYWPSYQTSEEQCAKECSSRKFPSECKSFSYSHGEKRCKMMANYYPTARKYKDYQFCRKNESICSFVDQSSHFGSFETVGLTQTKEECSLKAKDYDSASTGCMWNQKTYVCHVSYGNQLNYSPNDQTACLFNGQNFWSLDVPGKTCQDSKLITEVKSQILCQEMCIDDNNCIGISYAEYNFRPSSFRTYDWAWNCYICYDDVLVDSIEHKSLGAIGFRRRPE